jgi:hypothetical protein
MPRSFEKRESPPPQKLIRQYIYSYEKAFNYAMTSGTNFSHKMLQHCTILVRN